MFRTIKALFRALMNLINIFTGLINIGGSAVQDAQDEYDSWSARRKQSKDNLGDFHSTYDAVEEITERLNDIESLEISDDQKSVLKADLETRLANILTATPSQD